VTFDPNRANVHNDRGRVVADQKRLDDVIEVRHQTDELYQDPIAPFSNRSGQFERKEAAERRRPAHICGCSVNQFTRRQWIALQDKRDVIRRTIWTTLSVAPKGL